ncbi:MAG: hypothetical protein ACM31K_08685, partial [Solirubrobacterales bacterium]
GDRDQRVQQGGPGSLLEPERDREQPAHPGIQAVERPEAITAVTVAASSVRLPLGPACARSMTIQEKQ